MEPDIFASEFIIEATGVILEFARITSPAPDDSMYDTCPFCEEICNDHDDDCLWRRAQRLVTNNENIVRELLALGNRG